MARKPLPAGDAGYVNMKLPAPLARKVDIYIEANDLGYRSRQEVVAAAVREFLQREEQRVGGWKRDGK